jgi:CHAT domain-containing protein
MAKIVPALAGATSVLIAPDGALNVAPFSALVDDRGDFLVKRFTFTYLTSGRDLVHPRAGRSRSGGAVFAAPSFDAASAPASGTEPILRGGRSADLAQQTWPPLPGAAQEADASSSACTT